MNISVIIPSLNAGCPLEEVSTAKLLFAAWPAGLLLGQDKDAYSVLHALQDNKEPIINAYDIAHSILFGICSSSCLAPSDGVTLWSTYEPAIHSFLQAFEVHTQSSGLSA